MKSAVGGASLAAVALVSMVVQVSAHAKDFFAEVALTIPVLSIEQPTPTVIRAIDPSTLTFPHPRA